MQELAGEWYRLLGTLNAAVTDPLVALNARLGLPLLSALLFGLLGATSPCQLSTGASALAYMARQADDRRSVAWNALAYLLGKALVYTIVGVTVILVGRHLAQSSIPVFVATRTVLGPLMILLGLYLLRLVPLNLSVGQGLSTWLEARAGQGTGGAFLLGAAFSFAFCPTLFLLFFGLTIPLALRSPIGVLYPGVFALGTTLPLFALVALLVAGVGATKGYVRSAKRLDAWMRPVAAAALVLTGLNDTLTYWFL